MDQHQIKMQDIKYLCSINDSPIVITSIQYPFNILYVNKSWEYLCGYSPDEIIGQSILILKYKDISKNISINKKKNNNYFLHIFEIYNISSLNVSIGSTKYYKDL